MANRNWASGGKIYSMHVMPILLDCNFIVAPADAAGLGISSLKGPAIDKVYMHTSATPATGNPNPANGVIMVKLQDKYNKFFSAFSSVAAPAGTPTATLTVNVAYRITALGTATAAQWLAAGLPAGFTAAVGMPFVAAASALIGGSATAAPIPAAGSNIERIEVFGNPNLTLAPLGQYGAYLIFQCFDSTGAVAAPATGSLISLSMYLSNSSITVQGE